LTCGLSGVNLSIVEEADLRQVEDDDLFGEIRRRDIDDLTLISELKLGDELTRQANEVSRYQRSYMSRLSGASLKRSALQALAALTFVLILIIGGLALTGKEIPDLLSALAGSGIGAIAGILSGGTGAGGTGQSTESQALSGPLPPSS
jgi:hypothetical protein